MKSVAEIEAEVSRAFRAAFETHPCRTSDPGLALVSAREDAAEFLAEGMTGHFDDVTLTFRSDEGAAGYQRPAGPSCPEWSEFRVVTAAELRDFLTDPDMLGGDAPRDPEVRANWESERELIERAICDLDAGVAVRGAQDDDGWWFAYPISQES